MKFVFFSVSENGENGLGDEGADGSNAPPRIFGLEPPLSKKKHKTQRTRRGWRVVPKGFGASGMDYDSEDAVTRLTCQSVCCCNIILIRKSAAVTTSYCGRLANAVMQAPTTQLLA